MKQLHNMIIVIASLFLLQACDDDDKKTTPPAVPSAPVTITDYAVDQSNLSTLVAALQATGLDATLDDETANFTVFAPTDDAFALLGEDTINALLSDTDTLTDILTYHVIAGEVDAEAAIAAAGQTVEMVNGDEVGLSLSDGMLLVNTVTVTQTDIKTDNGIIHVIDAVLIPPAEKMSPTMNIVETAVSDGRFTTLVAALQAANLDAALADESSSYTVFAPTDDAFALIDPDVLAMILADNELLTNLLLQHVVANEVPSVTAYSLNGQHVTTLSDAMLPLAINTDTDQLMFGGANIVIKDIYTTNGVIHVIDAVVVGDLSLPSVANTVVDVAIDSGSFTTLVTALQLTGLDAVLSDENAQFTVFAPTDDAFAKLDEGLLAGLLANPDQLSSVLLYHVLSGAVLSDAAISVANSESNTVTTANGSDLALTLKDATLYANLAPVSAADIVADNGVIHVVDQVILPPAMMGGESMNIAEFASSLPQFSTLVTALGAANLVDTLADENASFTVFAPTNAAFDKIDDDTLSTILADTDLLTSILLKHVLPASVNSVAAYAAAGKQVDSVGGDKLMVELVDFTKSTNSANDEVAYNSEMQVLVGGMNAEHPGFTLYVFDNDLGQSSSVCVDACATNWPPVLVEDNEVDNIPGLSTIMRENGDMQAAYLGRPLYFYAGDENVGDMMGNGVNDVWWAVKQAPTSLQVQGANVTATDIYTTNGVIHVIDTVITSAVNE